MGADTPGRSAELGLDEGFALVAELEGEEVAALVEGAKEEFVSFPQLLRQELALRQPHELAFVAVGERAGELRAGEEVHVLDVQVKRCMYSTPHSSDTNVTSPRKRGSSMVSPVSSFTSRIAHSSGLSPYSNFPPTPIHLSPFSSCCFLVRWRMR